MNPKLEEIVTYKPSFRVILIGIAVFLVAFLVCTLLEYVMHRLMHKRILFGRAHDRHHADGYGPGWLVEFIKNLILVSPLVLALVGVGGLLYETLDRMGFLAVGLAGCLGCVAYAAVAAYAHQAQHERPELVVWMAMPVHYVHHRYNTWRENFGITTDIWDRLFKTYRQVDWQRPLAYLTPLSFFSISWLRPNRNVVIKPSRESSASGRKRVRVRVPQ